MSLRSLQGDVSPPEHLKGEVVRDLRARGLLRQRGASWLPLAAAFAGVCLFGSGYLLGRAREVAPSISSAPRYALLLYEDATFDRAQPESALVAEYSQWAGRLAQTGALVSGEKLGGSVSVEPAAGVRDLGEFTGFFVISAPSDSAARELARGTPHVRHGGRIVVRRVDPT